MTLASIAKRAEKLAIDNSPTILTGLAVAGTVATAIFAGRAAYLAATIIEDEVKNRQYKNVPFDLEDKVRMTWTLYIPSVGMGVTTIVCIISANRIGSKRAAAMAAAYTLSEKAFTEYKDKVVEKLGEKKEQAVRDEIQQDRVNRNPVSEVIIVSGEQLCYDSHSGRYFQSDMESVKKAVNDLNYRILSDNYASLSDFYHLLGLEPTSVSDEVGWNVDKLLEIHFTSTLAKDGRPAIALEYRVEPIRGYFRLH